MKRLPPCENPNCRVSTLIDETISFGRGGPDEFGFFKEGCLICAKAFKKKNPQYEVWPKC